MREGSPKQFSTADSLNSLRPGAKSLFQNILAVSPCGSRFCPDPLRSKRTKPFRINILRSLTEKVWSDRSQANSLFWKILPVSSCGSRFCKDPGRSLRIKSLRMNILEKAREKNCGRRSCQTPSPNLAKQPTRSGHGREAHTSSRQDRPTANQGTRRKLLDAV
jgi:hypothetical protein